MLEKPATKPYPLGVRVVKLSVPREPTQSMLNAGAKACPRHMGDTVMRQIWQAMHDAAPKAEA
jgi:hypothetical protein